MSSRISKCNSSIYIFSGLLLAACSGGSSPSSSNVYYGPASPPSISYALSEGTAGTAGLPMSIKPFTLLENGAPIINCNIKNGTPALPEGLAVDPKTCAISGTPILSLAPTKFIVVAANSAGTSSEADITIAVSPGIPLLDYSNSSGKIGTAGVFMSIKPSVLRSHAIGISSCSIKWGTTPLPSGLGFNGAACEISGYPDKGMIETPFVIRVTNNAGFSSDASLTLKINTPPPTLTYSSALTGSAGKQFSAQPDLNTYGATFVSCSVYSGGPQLPSGLTISKSSCAISGTPTSGSSTDPYLILVESSAGKTIAQVFLSISDFPPTALVYSTSPAGYVVGQQISPNVPSNSGGKVTKYSITPSLPEGLGFSQTTGVINGKPKYPSMNTKYVITASNASGTTSAELNIYVKAEIIPNDPQGLRVGYLDFYNVRIDWDTLPSGQPYFVGYRAAIIEGPTPPADCKNGQLIQGFPQAAFSDLKSGTQYSFRICSYYGSGNPGDETSPGQVISVTTPKASVATSITTGATHACATTEDKLYCWGSNQNGQLGTDTSPYTFSNRPMAVLKSSGTDYLTGVRSVSAGTNHTCAVTSEGNAVCWGDNSYGQLGSNSLLESRFPVNVLGLSNNNIVSIAAGDHHSCALTTSGSVYCWGDNSVGQLGNNSVTRTLYPTSVVSPTGSGLLTNIVSIAVGGGGLISKTCALDQTSTLYCWGAGINGSDTPVSKPTAIRMAYSGNAFSNLLNFSLGINHGCATSLSGNSWCWGENAKGQLGRNVISPTGYYSEPIETYNVGIGTSSVTDQNLYLSNLTNVFAGSQSSCATDNNRALYCWGDNYFGQLGINKDISQLLKAPALTGFTDVKSFSFGSSGYSCALTSKGAVFCAGNNSWSQLGNLGYWTYGTPSGVYGLH